MGITHLERRKIEAGVLVPMVQAFERAFGKAAADAVARESIAELAREDGERWARQFGDDIEGVARVCDVWSAGGGLEVEPLERSPDRLHFNVVRCRYAEHFKELGLPGLGHLFHCSRDEAVVEAFGGRIVLKRTQTIMEGADHCDFRFSRRA